MRRDGYVYLMRRADLYKIGMSRYPDWRARLLAGRAKDIEVVHAFPSDDARRVESTLHIRFSRKHVRGEWFRLDESDVRLFRRVKRCDKHTELPKALKPRYAECHMTISLLNKQFKELVKRSTNARRDLWQEVLLLIENYLAGPPIPAGVIPESIDPSIRKPYWGQKGRLERKFRKK